MPCAFLRHFALLRAYSISIYNQLFLLRERKGWHRYTFDTPIPRLHSQHLSAPAAAYISDPLGSFPRKAVLSFNRRRLCGIAFSGLYRNAIHRQEKAKRFRVMLHLGRKRGILRNSFYVGETMRVLHSEARAKRSF